MRVPAEVPDHVGPLDMEDVPDAVVADILILVK